jgi:AraC family transcriptional regulator
LDYIDGSIGGGLTVNEIAQIAGLSRYHFGKMFRRSTGVSLHQYVLWRRIRRAQEFLRNPRLPLADVAARVGFSSQTHFTTVFTNALGVAPGEYRKQI